MRGVRLGIAVSCAIKDSETSLFEVFTYVFTFRKKKLTFHSFSATFRMDFLPVPVHIIVFRLPTRIPPNQLSLTNQSHLVSFHLVSQFFFFHSFSILPLITSKSYMQCIFIIIIVYPPSFRTFVLSSTFLTSSFSSPPAKTDFPSALLISYLLLLLLLLLIAGEGRGGRRRGNRVRSTE